MSKPLILAVEDNPTQQKLIRILGDRLNYSAYVVGSCEEMIESLKMMPISSFSLVLMDWRLDVGEKSGLECTEVIRQLEEKSGTRIPIIGMTAYAMEGDRDKCLAAGMDDYLSKPFTIAQLQEILRKWLPETHAQSGNVYPMRCQSQSDNSGRTGEA